MATKTKVSKKARRHKPTDAEWLSAKAAIKRSLRRVPAAEREQVESDALARWAESYDPKQGTVEDWAAVCAANALKEHARKRALERGRNAGDVPEYLPGGLPADEALDAVRSSPEVREQTLRESVRSHCLREFRARWGLAWNPTLEAHARRPLAGRERAAFALLREIVDVAQRAHALTSELPAGQEAGEYEQFVGWLVRQLPHSGVDAHDGAWPPLDPRAWLAHHWMRWPPMLQTVRSRSTGVENGAIVADATAPSERAMTWGELAIVSLLAGNWPTRVEPDATVADVVDSERAAIKKAGQRKGFLPAKHARK